MTQPNNEAQNMTRTEVLATMNATEADSPTIRAALLALADPATLGANLQDRDAEICYRHLTNQLAEVIDRQAEMMDFLLAAQTRLCGALASQARERARLCGTPATWH